MPPARPGRVRRRSGLLSFFSGVGPWVALWLVAVVFSYTALTHKPAGGGPRRGYPTGYDANGYYAWARSLWFDGDMDFRNDFAFVARTQPPGSRDPFVAALLEADAAGRGPDNVFNCGTGLAALPAMAIASGLDRIRVAVSGGPPASPFSPWYVFAFQIMHAAYGVGALMLARTLAARLYGRHAANVGSWGAMLCGPPVFYLLFEPGMSHLAGAFFGSVCAVSWASTFAPGGTRAAPERPRVGLAAVAGLAAGFATCVRPYNLPLGLLLVEPAVRAVLSSNRRRDFGPAMAWSAVGLAGAAVGFAPQLAVWRAQYGTWLGNPTGFRFLPWPPFAHLVLFGARHGLFQWAPLFSRASSDWFSPPAGCLQQGHRGRGHAFVRRSAAESRPDFSPSFSASPTCMAAGGTTGSAPPLVSGAMSISRGFSPSGWPPPGPPPPGGCRTETRGWSSPCSPCSTSTSPSPGAAAPCGATGPSSGA